MSFAVGSPHPLHIRLLIVIGLFKKRSNLGFSPVGAKLHQLQELVNQKKPNPFSFI